MRDRLRDSPSGPLVCPVLGIYQAYKWHPLAHLSALVLFLPEDVLFNPAVGSDGHQEDPLQHAKAVVKTWKFPVP